MWAVLLRNHLRADRNGLCARDALRQALSHVEGGAVAIRLWAPTTSQHSDPPPTPSPFLSLLHESRALCGWWLWFVSWLTESDVEVRKKENKEAPRLRQSEVREWASEWAKSCIAGEGGACAAGSGALPGPDYAARPALLRVAAQSLRLLRAAASRELARGPVLAP